MCYKHILVLVFLALMALASCDSGAKWCKDKRGSKHLYPDKRGCCPKQAQQQVTYIEDIFNSTLIVCTYRDGSFFARYGADAVPPVNGKSRGYFTPFLGVSNFFEVLPDGSTLEGIQWFNFLPNGDVVGHFATDLQPFVVGDFSLRLISTERPPRCQKHKMCK